MKYFQAVASTLNISKACSLVHLSQPALSLQIQGLENDIGFKLFERNNRGMVLTEEGLKLQEQANLLLEWQHQTTDLIFGLNQNAGLLKIGTYTTASSYLLSPILKEFFKLYNDINISYDYSSTDQIIEKIKLLKLDCAIISEVPEDRGVTAIPFFRNELILVSSIKNKIRSKIKPRDLANYPFLSYPLRLDYCYKEIERKVGKHLKQSKVKIESESFDTLKQSLLADLGITFMPKYLIEDELKSKKLKAISVNGLSLPITFSFVIKKDRKLPARIEVFKEYLLSKFRI